MTERILGEAGSKRRWRFRFLVLPILLGGAFALFMAGGALAVHDTGAFQLDGNAQTSNLGTPPSNGAHDWDQVCYQATTDSRCGTTTPAAANAVSWTGDILNGSTDVFANDPNATIFTGGGSKDGIDISSWAWKDGAGGLPDKDNLNHSFAARYNLPPDADGTNGTLCPAGTALTCDVLFFGSDRFDNSGDAQQGFWFFQNKVTLSNVKNGGGFTFSGVHRNGDLLIISDFSNGGTTSTISIYKWNSGVSGNLELLATSTAANCLQVGVGDSFCGIVNSANGTIAPWPYTDKSGNHTYLQGEFYEGGVNLSTLGLAGECFSSVASETRSSTSTTATLKDFVLGQFKTCAPTMDTEASATTASPVTPGTAVHDTATISISGGTNPPDPTGDVTFFLCGPIASGDCSTGGTNIGTGTLNGGANTTDGLASAQSPDVNTAASVTGVLGAGRYCFRAEWPGDGNYDGTSFTNATDECFAVKDTSSTSTAQNWLPNDSAHVTTGSGAAASGTVTFTLYGTANCTGSAITTFANRSVNASGDATTNNSTFAIAVTPGETISWRATFTPTDPNAINGSTSHCETSTVTINNDIGS